MTWLMANDQLATVNRYKKHSPGGQVDREIKAWCKKVNQLPALLTNSHINKVKKQVIHSMFLQIWYCQC